MCCTLTKHDNAAPVAIDSSPLAQIMARANRLADLRKFNFILKGRVRDAARDHWHAHHSEASAKLEARRVAERLAKNRAHPWRQGIPA